MDIAWEFEVVGRDLDLTKVKTLVVDDMSSMRMMIKAVLRETGITMIAEAGDGSKAIDLLSGGSFDLVVCDWDMPTVSGLEVLKNVRGTSKTRQLPFIMLTANAAGDYVGKAIDAGVSDYLTKPFKPTDLVRKVKRVLRA